MNDPRLWLEIALALIGIMSTMTTGLLGLVIKLLLGRLTAIERRLERLENVAMKV